MKERKLRIAEFIDSLDKGINSELVITQIGGSVKPGENTGNCRNRSMACVGTTNTGQCKNSKDMCTGSINGNACTNIIDPGIDIFNPFDICGGLNSTTPNA